MPANLSPHDLNLIADMVEKAVKDYLNYRMDQEASRIPNMIKTELMGFVGQEVREVIKREVQDRVQVSLRIKDHTADRDNPTSSRRSYPNGYSLTER